MDCAANNINWWRGLFRLWAVFSVIWILSMGYNKFGSYEHIASWSKVITNPAFIQLSPDDKERAIGDYIKQADIKFDFKGAKNAGYSFDEISSFLVSKQEHDSALFLKYVSIFLPPIILLFLIFSTKWIMKGFKQ